MQFGAYLAGPFGQSQELYKARNEAKRGRGSPEAVREIIHRDTKTVIRRQRDAGLDYITDPMFEFYYLLQPFAEKHPDVAIGPQENWFNNNVFYRVPQIHGPLDVKPTVGERVLNWALRRKPKHPLFTSVGFTDRYFNRFLLPKNKMVILPSPYTLLMLSDVDGYKDDFAAVKNLARVLKEEAEYFVEKGFTRIQFDEPAFVYKHSLDALKKKDAELLKLGMLTIGKVKGATTSLHTYFGSSGMLIPFLLSLPIDCLGIDCTETPLEDILRVDFTGKEVALGLVNARNTALEDPKQLADIARQVAEKNPTAVWVTPNTGTEYRGWTHGLHKINLLEQVVGELHD